MKSYPQMIDMILDATALKDYLFKNQMKCANETNV